MYGRKRGIRRYNSYRGSRDKYSQENTLVSGQLTNVQTDPVSIVEGYEYQTVQTVIAATEVYGVRKVKHIKFSWRGASDCIFAVVYVPHGTSPNYLAQLAHPGQMYEPSQFVMLCGQLDSSAGPVLRTVPVARNLHEGDQIVLLFAATTALNYYATITYSICYN